MYTPSLSVNQRFGRPDHRERHAFRDVCSNTAFPRNPKSRLSQPAPSGSGQMLLVVCTRKASRRSNQCWARKGRFSAPIYIQCTSCCCRVSRAIRASGTSSRA
jgi:hypothetical protein